MGRVLCVAVTLTGGPDDVCRKAQHLSFLRQEAQETHHEEAGAALNQGILLKIIW